jgi:uncharacterized membrane protein
VFESLFQFFFEYRPVVFQQGEFRFSPSAGSYVAAAAATIFIFLTFVTYRRAGHSRDRLVLTSLRVAALLLIVFCLFRPVLVVRAAVPQQNFLAVLVDDSRSMQIGDWNGQTRGAFVQQEFGGPEAPTLAALAQRFVIRPFRFASQPSRHGASDSLAFEGSQTKLGAALDGVRQEMAGLPLAGIVLVSDGADTTEAALTDALLGMKAASVPVFTVGVGRDRLARDIQLDRISTPRTALKGSSLVVDAVITQTGFAGETVSVVVEDGGQTVGTQEVTLPSDGAPAAVRVRFMAAHEGPRMFRFSISPRSGELVTQNNAREALIDVQDRREKILYFEGEPRWEMKYIRRAVADDENLQLVALQRTADNKYLRLDVDTPEHLLGGFPRSRDELFQYRGLVLGSIEAGAFTGDQLRMISDFVERRGGGLLMLGGGRSFSEGGYAETPVAEALPVVLARPARVTDDPPFSRIRVQPTRAGLSHAVTQIAGTEAESAARWKDLPTLTSVNPVTEVKPGATVLLNGTDERRRDQVVLASQRYGRGKTMAFTVQDSWNWQMDADIPLEDTTHETYWRQLLRWLVDGVPDHVHLYTAADRVEPGEQVTLTADVVDPGFVEVNDAFVMARVTGPDGEGFDVPMQWTGSRDGQYRGTFTADADGIYAVRAEAMRAGTSLGTGLTQVRAGAGDAEYFDAVMHAARLQRIAEETGGRFYTPETVAGLPEDVQYTGRGVTTTEERELWHMPIVLMALLGLVGAEWGYRRMVGLA